MTPEQVINARGLLGWSVKRLSVESGAGVSAIFTYETSGRMPKSTRRSSGVDRIALIRAALEAAGAEFVEQAGGAPSVRLQKEITE